MRMTTVTMMMMSMTLVGCVIAHTETSAVDAGSCVVALARCLDNPACQSSLRRVKIDCVWNDTTWSVE